MQFQSHERYAEELGVPADLPPLLDQTFEALSNGDAQAWPEQVLDATPVGVDLRPAMHRIKARILREVGWFAEHKDDKNDELGVIAAVQRVAKLHDECVDIDDSRWSAARSAAWIKIGDIILEELGAAK